MCRWCNMKIKGQRSCLVCLDVLCFEEIPLHNFSSKHPKSSQQYHKTWVHKEFPRSITVAFSTFRSLFLFVNRDSSVKWGGSELEMMVNLWILMDKIAKGATRVKALANGYKCKTLSRQLDVLNERTSECVCVFGTFSLYDSASKRLPKWYILCWGWFLFVALCLWYANCWKAVTWMCVRLHCDDVISWCYCLTICCSFLNALCSSLFLASTLDPYIVCSVSMLITSTGIEHRTTQQI